MYPIAWAVVEKENNDSWDWFVDILFRDLKIGDGENWVIMSDQQKGILMLCKGGHPEQNTETVSGTSMPIGGRSTRVRIGRKNFGGVLRLHVGPYLTWLGQSWPKLL